MSESDETPAETPVEDHRAPLDEQPIALSVAEEAGVEEIAEGASGVIVAPPEVPVTVIDAPSGMIATSGILPVGEKTPDLHIIKDRGDGVLIDGFGCVVIR